MGKKLKIHWGRISIVSVIAFIVGWLLLGLPWAIIIAIIVMFLMGIIDIA